MNGMARLVARRVGRTWRVRAWSISRGAETGWGRYECLDCYVNCTEHAARRLGRAILARVPGATRVECRSGARVVTVSFTG